DAEAPNRISTISPLATTPARSNSTGTDLSGLLPGRSLSSHQLAWTLTRRASFKDGTLSRPTVCVGHSLLPTVSRANSWPLTFFSQIPAQQSLRKRSLLRRGTLRRSRLHLPTPV